MCIGGTRALSLAMSWSDHSRLRGNTLLKKEASKHNFQGTYFITKTCFPILRPRTCWRSVRSHDIDKILNTFLEVSIAMILSNDDRLLSSCPREVESNPIHFRPVFPDDYINVYSKIDYSYTIPKKVITNKHGRSKPEMNPRKVTAPDTL